MASLRWSGVDGEEKSEAANSNSDTERQRREQREREVGRAGAKCPGVKALTFFKAWMMFALIVFGSSYWSGASTVCGLCDNVDGVWRESQRQQMYELVRLA